MSPKRNDSVLIRDTQRKEGQAIMEAEVEVIQLQTKGRQSHQKA